MNPLDTANRLAYCMGMEERAMTTTATDRNVTIAAIRKALRARSGKAWSVTGGSGTAWGWIRIHVPPAKRSGSMMSDEARAELGTLLGLPPVHPQGVSIPSSNDYYREYTDRAEGRTPSKIAQPYWD
jgi:hypothetical protein